MGFRYYEIPVKFESSVKYVTVNVGYGLTDNKYHIYDLTEPKERNTPNRINGFARSVDNVLRKGVSTNSIPKSSENVNSKFSHRDSDGNNQYIVRSVVNKYSNEVKTVDVLYAINAKKETAVLNATDGL